MHIISSAWKIIHAHFPNCQIDIIPRRESEALATTIKSEKRCRRAINHDLFKLLCFSSTMASFYSPFHFSFVFEYWIKRLSLKYHRHSIKKSISIILEKSYEFEMKGNYYEKSDFKVPIDIMRAYSKKYMKTIILLLLLL